MNRSSAANPAAFEALAAAFARTLEAGDVVALEGGLGSGKTTFVAAAVRALGNRATFEAKLAAEAKAAGGTFNDWVGGLDEDFEVTVLDTPFAALVLESHQTDRDNTSYIS